MVAILAMMPLEMMPVGANGENAAPFEAPTTISAIPEIEQAMPMTTGRVIVSRPKNLLSSSTLTDAAVTPTAWRWVYVVGVVLALAGAVLALFARPGAARPSATPDPALDAWKALDAGADPTAADERVTGGEGPRDQQQ